MISLVARTGKRQWVSASVKSLLTETGRRDPVEAMQFKASALLDKCEFDAAPVDHEMIASFRGIDNVQAVDMTEAGAIVPKQAGGFLVLVNERDSAARQRFSCLHEVSHTLFPNYMASPTKKMDAVIGEYGEDKEEEYLCDVGAAELLMPRRFLHPAIRDMGCTIDTIVELARLYVASLEAMAVQFAKTNIHDCAVIVWQPAHKPSQRDAVNPAQVCFDGMEELSVVPKQLRTKYAIASDRFSHFFPKDKSVETNSAIEECFLTGKSRNGESLLFVGNGLKSFYTENLYVAARTDEGASKGRVITLVLALH